MTNIEELCGDPLFQLNLSIWLAQPKPEAISVRPVLYESGFQILSIGPLLSLPVGVRQLVGQAEVDCQDAVKPDLIFMADKERRLLILECKRSSFGPSSSTAEQARTLLLVSGPIIAEVLALERSTSAKGVLCYLTRADQAKPLQNTLSQLRQEIQTPELKTGEHGCLGIRPDKSAIVLDYSDDLKSLLKLAETSPVKVLTLEEGTDPRPLYFIPYDPTIEQSEEEKALSRRIFYERFLSHIISKIGPANVPSEVVFTTEKILTAATFGVYEMWEDRDAKKHIRTLVRDFLGSLIKALKEEQRNYVKHERGKGWVFTFEDQDNHKEILTQVQKFNPERLDLSREIEPGLFDD